MVNVINNQDEYKNKIIQSLHYENEELTAKNERLEANMDYISMMTGVEIDEEKNDEISEV